jgi:PAS domain S-box-containing protein
VIQLDASGRIASWNAGAERLTGFLTVEIMGEPVARLYPLDEVAAGVPARDLETARTRNGLQAPRRRVRRDGSEFWTHMVLKPVRDESAAVCGYRMVLVETGKDNLATPRPPAVPVTSRDVSHELRNRIAVIGNAIYYLKLVLPEGGEADEYLDILTREVRAVNRLLTGTATRNPGLSGRGGSRRSSARRR